MGKFLVSTWFHKKGGLTGINSRGSLPVWITEKGVISIFLYHKGRGFSVYKEQDLLATVCTIWADAVSWWLWGGTLRCSDKVHPCWDLPETLMSGQIILSPSILSCTNIDKQPLALTHSILDTRGVSVNLWDFVALERDNIEENQRICDFARLSPNIRSVWVLLTFVPVRRWWMD